MTVKEAKEALEDAQLDAIEKILRSSFHHARENVRFREVARAIRLNFKDLKSVMD